MPISVDVAFGNILLYLLVFARLAGMIGFNPIFSRTGVSYRVRAGLVFFMTALLAPGQTAAVGAAVYNMNAFQFAFAVAFELGIGLVLGFVFQIFSMMLFYAGDIIDQDIGLAMAKSFDPGANIQTGFTSSVLNTIFFLYIFVTGSHLTLLHIFAQTFTAVEVGSFRFSVPIISFIIRLFVDVFVLVLRLVAPFMVAEFALQACLGMLMRFVPQISIFVINFQMKVGLGLIMLMVFAPFIGTFITQYVESLMDALVRTVELLA